MPSSNRPQSQRKLSLETLEKRYLMTGGDGDFTEEQLEMLQENYADYIGNILLREDQWDEESLARLIDGSVGDNEFIGLGNLIAGMEDKRDLIRSLDTRGDLLEEDLAGIETEITQDTAELQRQGEILAECTELLRDLTVEIEVGIKEIQSLTDTITALLEEDREVDEQIPQLERDAKTLRVRVNDLSEQCTTVEEQMEEISQSMQICRKRIETLAKMLGRHRNPLLREQLRQARMNYANLEKSYVSCGDQLTILRKQEADANEALATTVDILGKSRARNDAIPQEIDSAEKGKEAALQHLQETERESEEVSGILAMAEEASDALEADLLRAADMHEIDEALLTTIATDITREFEDLKEIRNVLRTSMEELLGAEEEPLADTDTVSQQVALTEGSLQEDGSWLMDLPEIGGTASFGTWPKVPAFLVESIEGALLHRALVGAGITQEQIDASPALGALLGLEEGHQQGTQYIAPGIYMPLREKTITHPTLGTVTVQTHSWKPMDQRDYKHAFLLNQQGDVSGGWFSLGNNYALNEAGSGPISLSFAEPRYVQWVEVKHLGGDNHGTLTVTRADGSTYPIYLSSGSTKIPIDEPILSLRITMDFFNAHYAFGKINTDAPVGIPDIPAGEKWLQSNGFVTALDLGKAGKMVSVVNVRVTADRPNVAVTAYAYRGDTLIQTQEVGADGMVHLADEGGITSVVLAKQDQIANLIVSPVATTGWKDLPQPAADPLSTANNGTIAHEGAMPWGIVPENYYHLMQHLNINFSPGPHIATPTTGYRIFPGVTNTEGYTIHQVETGDAVSIREVLYFTGDGHGGGGLYSLPQSYWQYVDGQYGKAIITYPGCPTHIVFGVGGDGTFFLGANGKRGERLTDVMPSLDMKLDMGVLYSRREPSDEGWMDVPMEGVPTTNFHGSGGDEFGILFRVDNLGIGGGQILARIHVGQSGSADDPVVKEFEGEITSLSRQALWVNTELRQTGDYVTLEILDLEGNTIDICPRKIHPPRVGTMTDAERQAEMGSRRIQTLNARIVDAVHNSPTLDNWRESVSSSGQALPTMATLDQSLELTAAAIEKDYLVFLERGVSAEELHDMILAKLKDIVVSRKYLSLADIDLDTELSYDAFNGDDGNNHGSAPAIIPPEKLVPATAMQDLLKLYQDPSPESPVQIRGKFVNKETQIGRIFLGLFQNMLSASDFDLRVMCAQAGVVTGLNGTRLENLTHINDYDRYIEALIKTFTEMGHGAIFQDSSNYMPEDAMHVSPEQSYYRNGYVRVFFDQPRTINGKDIAFTRVYLINAITGQQIDWAGGEEHFVEVSNQTYADISVGRIRKVIGPQSVPLQIKIGSWPVGAEDASGVLRAYSTKEFVVEPGDYSTLPPGPEHDREMMFLSDLSFPVTPGDWKFGMNSTEHDGLGLYAIDFNVAGDADKDRIVKAACRGTVTQVNLEQGKVVIKYNNADGTHYSITTYHMTHIFEDLTGITYLGAKEARVKGANEQVEAVTRAKAQAAIDTLLTRDFPISADARIGKVGDEGYSFGYHLDFRIHLSDGTAVNTYRWADGMQPGFQTTGMVGNKEITMHWSDDAMTLVNDTEKIALKRVDILNDNNEAIDAENLAYAWEPGKTIEQMTRVKWSLVDPLKNRFGWIAWDTQSNSPLLLDGHMQEWTPSNSTPWTSVN